MPDQSFDLVILGGGSGGYAAGLRAAELGMSVGMIEKDKVGGTCLHRGCIPTKALLHAAEIADAARDSEQFGIRASLDGIDIEGVTRYRTGIVAKKHRGLQSLLKARGITTIEGAGTLTLGVNPNLTAVFVHNGTVRLNADNTLPSVNNVTVVATDTAGNSSAPVTTRFKIRPKRN